MAVGVNLQVRLPKNLRDEAEKLAQEEGFSSLQELVRVFIANYKNKKTSFGFNNEISEEAAMKYYLNSEEAYKKVKDGDIPLFSNSKDAIEYLKSV